MTESAAEVVSAAKCDRTAERRASSADVRGARRRTLPDPNPDPKEPSHVAPFSSRTRSTSPRSRNSRARRTNLERLEERQLLSAAEFELSSLLPANGGDGSKGFVVNGIVDRGKLGHPRFGYQPLGDVNQDGIDDLLVAAAGQGISGAAAPTPSDAYLIFGRPGGFPAELDLNSLDGTTGYAIHDAVVGDGRASCGGGAGDLNHDGVPDLVLGAIGAIAVGRPR